MQAKEGILNTIFVPISMSSAVKDPQGFGPLGKAIISLFLVSYHRLHQFLGS